MSNSTKIVLGLVGAAAAGVIVGLMLAPEKGTEFRAKISQKAGDWTDSLTDIFANAKGEIQNLVSKGAKAAGDAKENYS